MNKSCGCCEGVHLEAPEARHNRPGLGALRYRVGTHASFFSHMSARLSGAGVPELAALSTRDTSDPAIALLDSWACVADVLSFYQERIANEGYLRTALERRSVLELARLVGYRLRPGVAASVYLAYTLEKDTQPVTIPKGSRVNSIPAPGEQMQVFETSEALDARWQFNQLRARTRIPHTVETIVQRNRVYLAGTTTGLKINDILLVDVAGDPARPLVMRVLDVLPDDKAAHTRVNLAMVQVKPALLSAQEIWAKAVAKQRNKRFADVRKLAHKLVNEALPVHNSKNRKKLEQALGTLTALEKDAGRRTLTPPELLDIAAAALAEIRPDAPTAALEKFATWLDGVVDALSVLNAAIAADVMPPQPAPDAPPAFDDDDEFDPPATGAPPDSTVPKLQVDAVSFKSLVAALKQAPSVPPASSRQLRRDADATFAPRADIYARLVAAMLPAAGAQLYAGLGSIGSAASSLRVRVLRRALPMFGHNAPPRPILIGSHIDRYEEWNLEPGQKQVELDAAYEKVSAGSYTLIERAGVLPVLARIESAQPVSVARYGMAGRTTRLLIDQEWVPMADGELLLDVLRSATVHVQQEELALAEEPVEESVKGNVIELDALYEGLESGRWLIISGERIVAGASGIMGAELLMLAAVEGTAPVLGRAPHTRIVLGTQHGVAGLAYEYKRDTVTIHANVVHATHGETRNEVLGSGAAAIPMQAFVLRQPPLTWVSASVPSGVASTLEVRVNNVRWHEAGSVADLGPQDRSFVTQTDDEGRTSVIFGDGKRGARLPTGAENITARYRNGVGKGGNVRSGQLSLLATKPLGVKEVTNPIGASGGADREGRDQARAHAPLAVTALDRLVSTRDYADFARLFGGIGKASASRLADGGGQTVVVTIAGVADAPIDETSDVMRNLKTALLRYGDPFVPVLVKVRELQALVISASVKVLPDYDWEFVEPAVRAILLETFGFERREMGQGVAYSQVLAAIHRVPGVAYVDLEPLATISPDQAAQVFVDSGEPGNLTGRPASINNGMVQQAQLIYLMPSVRDTLILNEVKS